MNDGQPKRRLGVIGRHAALLEFALARASALGHEARGTLEDEVALAWLAARDIDALVVGGGVESPSRRRLLDACAAADVEALEVHGPENLERVLSGLLR